MSFALRLNLLLFLQQTKVRKFGPKILQLLKEWTETFPSDFRDEKMVGHLEDIIHRIAACDEVQSAPLDAPTRETFSAFRRMNSMF